MFLEGIYIYIYIYLWISNFYWPTTKTLYKKKLKHLTKGENIYTSKNSTILIPYIYIEWIIYIYIYIYIEDRWWDRFSRLMTAGGVFILYPLIPKKLLFLVSLKRCPQGALAHLPHIALLQPYIINILAAKSTQSVVSICVSYYIYIYIWSSISESIYTLFSYIYSYYKFFYMLTLVYIRACKTQRLRERFQKQHIKTKSNIIAGDRMSTECAIILKKKLLY